MQLTPILKKIEEYLLTQQSTAGALLQKGLSIAEIQKQIVPLQYGLPPEVFELYEWKNGIRETQGQVIGELELFPWGIFNSLETSLSTHQSRSGKGYCGRKHFPLFTTGGGDFLLINCDPNDVLYGYIFAQSHALYGDELRPRYQSLKSLFQCVLECYEKGAYVFVDGALEEDDDIADPIIDKYEIEG